MCLNPLQFLHRCNSAEMDALSKSSMHGFSVSQMKYAPPTCSASCDSLQINSSERPSIASSLITNAFSFFPLRLCTTKCCAFIFTSFLMRKSVFAYDSVSEFPTPNCRTLIESAFTIAELKILNFVDLLIGKGLRPNALSPTV